MGIPRLMIAGTGSSCGKTTITCALLRALATRGKRLSAFKCGPDYIDPMFHTEVTGVPCRNLDLFLMGEEGVLGALSRSQGDLAVIELSLIHISLFPSQSEDPKHISSFS